MKIKYSFALILSLILLQSAFAADPAISQRVLSPLEIFSRCYAHITQLKLPVSHPKRAAVIAGTLSPIDACMQVLSGANLNTAGTIASTVTVGSVNESLSVLRTFSNYNISLTENPDLNNSVPGGIYAYGTRFIYDEGEFGLHFTRAMFAPGAKASDIVTLGTSMEALRDQGQKASFPSSSSLITIPTVQTGNFLGVRLMTANAEKTNLSRTPTDGDGNPFPIQMHRHEGGGVIGTPAYILANLGRGLTQRADGGISVARRFGKAVYKDLLCRDVPVVRGADAAPFVQTGSSLPFRKSTSCMQCHASIDPLGNTARNFMYVVDEGKIGGGAPYRFAPSQGAEAGPVDSDQNFHQRPPNGKLYFRSYDGTLIDRSVTSMGDLGQKISETEDYYACIASKYFQYFTGIKANLQDAGDNTLPTLSAGDQVYRDRVIQLGKSLKTSQNIQSLIREIISSDSYKRASNRDSK